MDADAHIQPDVRRFHNGRDRIDDVCTKKKEENRLNLNEIGPASSFLLIYLNPFLRNSEHDQIAGPAVQTRNSNNHPRF